MKSQPEYIHMQKFKSAQIQHRLRHLTLALNILWLSTALSGDDPQQTAPSPEVESLGWMEDFLNKLGADGGYNPEKTIDWSALPGPFYTPEKEFGIGMSAVGLYQPDPNDLVSQVSSLTVNGFFSSNGSIGGEVISQTFLKEDRYRLLFYGEVISAPEVFYGAGIEAGRDEANRVDYTRRGYQLQPKALMQVLPATFIGVGADVSHNSARHISTESGNPSSSDGFFPDDSTSVGFTTHLLYDSRDVVLNASKGFMFQLDAAIYQKAYGSSTNFEKFNLDYRDYWKLGNGILAWQLAGEFHHGDVPWDKMAKLGGATRLRGYEDSRYRDRQMALGQIEYRHNLPGRHGMVYWVGAGTLSDQLKDLGSEEWLHSVGLGYRFEIKERVNLRLDMAWGNGDNGFYFGVNEVF